MDANQLQQELKDDAKFDQQVIANDLELTKKYVVLKLAAIQARNLLTALFPDVKATSDAGKVIAALNVGIGDVA